MFFNVSGERKSDKSPNQEDYLMHMHNHYEIFCFLEGNANYIVEGMVYHLSPGDFVLMRRGESHHICFLSDCEYKRMTVHFSPTNEVNQFYENIMKPFNDRPLGIFNHYPAASFSNQYLLHCIEQICRTDDLNIRSSYLIVLLNELSSQFREVKQRKTTSKTNLYATIIQYINDHLTESLSLEQISEYFFISKSQLNRNFKSIIGSTVWEYITKKRLILARKQIEEGLSPSQAYISCGFNDYTAFYRAYRKRFGFPPSKTKTIL